MLNYVNSESVNIMTLEDPVEYPMPMIRQTSVNEAAKLDFASGIRSMMRQDPDIILVGEVRDEDTADMAFRAAMTGHQVFSTLHTNSAIGAIPRLLDIGIVPDILAGNIIGIVAQRLVRRLCPHCHNADKPNELESHLLGLKEGERPDHLSRRGLRSLQPLRLQGSHGYHGAAQGRPGHGRPDCPPGLAAGNVRSCHQQGLSADCRRWSAACARRQYDTGRGFARHRLTDRL